MTDRSSLITAVDAHFLAPEALARVRLFSRLGRDVEGWFKGELAYVFESLRREGAIGEWRANVPLREDGRQRCDFRIVLSGEPLWLEVKALPQRSSSGGRVDPGFFLQKGGPGDVTEDLVKLMRVPDGESLVLLFAYPRPDPAGWSEIMSAYARRITPISFREESRLDDYPEELYVCKLSLEGGF